MNSEQTVIGVWSRFLSMLRIFGIGFLFYIVAIFMSALAGGDINAMAISGAISFSIVTYFELFRWVTEK